jgi:hypothetical protein
MGVVRLVGAVLVASAALLGTAPAAAGGLSWPPPGFGYEPATGFVADAEGDLPEQATFRRPEIDIVGTRVVVTELGPDVIAWINGLDCGMQNGVVVACGSGAGDLSSGPALIAETQAAGPIPTGPSAEVNLNYGVAVDGDGDPANNVPTGVPQVGLLQQTDSMWDLLRGSDGWRLIRSMHTADEGLQIVEQSDARAIVTDSTVVVIVPGTEYTVPAPAARTYTIGQDTSRGQVGGDSSPRDDRTHTPAASRLVPASAIASPAAGAANPPAQPGAPETRPAGGKASILDSFWFWLGVTLGGGGLLAWGAHAWFGWTPWRRRADGPQLTFDAGPLAAFQMPAGADGYAAGTSFVAAYGERAFALMKKAGYDPFLLARWDHPVAAPEEDGSAGADPVEEHDDLIDNLDEPFPIDNRVAHIKWSPSMEFVRAVLSGPEPEPGGPTLEELREKGWKDLISQMQEPHSARANTATIRARLRNMSARTLWFEPGHLTVR